MQPPIIIVVASKFNLFHLHLIVYTGILEVVQMSQDAEKGAEREGQGEEKRQKGKEKEVTTYPFTSSTH